MKYLLGNHIVVTSHQLPQMQPQAVKFQILDIEIEDDCAIGRAFSACTGGYQRILGVRWRWRILFGKLTLECGIGCVE